MNLLMVNLDYIYINEFSLVNGVMANLPNPYFPMGRWHSYVHGQARSANFIVTVDG